MKAPILYKIKEEARPFFSDKITDLKECIGTWHELGVDPKALEEVGKAYLTYGHLNLDSGSNYMSGWSEKEGSHFHFTIVFPDSKYQDHDHLKDESRIKNLLSVIEKKANDFYDELIPNEAE